MGTKTEMNYEAFIKGKYLRSEPKGFKPKFLPDFLFDFQRELVDWSVRIGCGSLFEDCGLGKTPQQLVWAQNVLMKTNKPVLILAPIAVSQQTVNEGDKFGIEVHRSRDGKVKKGINIVNYERLHYFDPKDFAGVVSDESSILKNFDGKTRKAVTEFMSGIPYRLLCTATPAPNDYMELGSSSEALGVMPRNQMLGMFFTNGGESTQQWELRGHARVRFWKWVATWARAIRKPSDLGYEDGDFLLPELLVNRHTLPSPCERGKLFPRLAKTLNEQRDVRRKTIKERVEKVTEIIPKKRPCIVWCHLNAEADALEREIPGALQVSGSDRDEVKEERLIAFSNGEIRVLVTKPKIAGFGLNWQHCSDVVYFPSHSHEQYYQAIRRCWRFGQRRKVTCNLVSMEAEQLVVRNMLRKEQQSQALYDGIVRHMAGAISQVKQRGDFKVEVPSWLTNGR